MDRLRCPGTGPGSAGRQHGRQDLKRRLVQERRLPPQRSPGSARRRCGAPAQSWSADFKGDVPLANGKRCYPLTLTGTTAASSCSAAPSTRPPPMPSSPGSESVFREYGLPGHCAPTTARPLPLAAGGLSQLSKWWIPGHSPPSAFVLPSPVRTVAMNACIAR